MEESGQRLTWWAKFKEVKEFYKEHGHTSIPSERLRNWFRYQRKTATTLTQEQTQALSTIEFISVRAFREEETWNSNFNRLISDPSAKYDPTIRSWISRQRALRESGKLMGERLKKLEDHGIDLNRQQAVSSKRKRSEKNEENWNQRFEKLQEYKKIHGDTNVPLRYAADKSLGQWVANQRRTGKDGSTTLEKDKIDKLNSIGFVWNMKQCGLGGVATSSPPSVPSLHGNECDISANRLQPPQPEEYSTPAPIVPNTVASSASPQPEEYNTPAPIIPNTVASSAPLQKSSSLPMVSMDCDVALPRNELERMK